MAPGSAGAGSTRSEDLPIEKNAGLIMGTNNSSIVSKRSVERLYLPKPHFYRYFVRKPQRRSPTINRGYWLRMRAIDWVVRKFLERPSDHRKVVINIGCGYDPLPFQWLATEPTLCDSVKFIDVDYEELMNTKREIILDTPEMKELLTFKEGHRYSAGVMLESDQYAAVGCDLRNLRKLGKLLRQVANLDRCMILCVAEVSITYMSTPDADAVISWATTLSSDVTFTLLEQWSPDSEENPFTATMLKHFAKLGTPLRSVLTYPGDHNQTQRFLVAGYALVEAQSLWQLWGDSRFLSPSQRMALDQVEPFDEWEEFALFASHYGLVIAQTSNDPLFPELGRARRDSNSSNLSELSTRTVSPNRAEKQWFAYKYSENPGDEGRTHHASAYSASTEDTIAIHGGVGLRTRLSTTAVYASSDANSGHPVVPPQEIGARCAHTITTLGNRQNILIGGRASPSAPMKDCWLQTGSIWERIQDLPEPRFRHRSVAVMLPENQYGVIVFGGKTSATTVAIDVLLWSPREGWKKLRSLRQDPIPRFGASFVRLGFNHGLMFGGMRQDGIVCQGLWRWRLIIRDNVIAGIRFKTSTALDTSVGIYPWLGRLGASYSVIRNELLVIGGVAKLGCIPKQYEILSILGSFSAFGEFEKEMELRITCVTPRMSPEMPRPFLIGHCSHRTEKETTLIVGGGCTCFSFGAYWNTGVWLMHDREAGVSSNWALIRHAPPTPEETRISDSAHLNGVESPTPVAVEQATINTQDEFTNLLHDSVPKVIKDLDIGPCTKSWTPAYLKSKTPPTRTVVVHSSPTTTMNFQRKDSFNYTTLPFHTFLDILNLAPLDPTLQPHMYMRSISSKSPNSKPANLATDWPELASDFILPPQLAYISQTMHSNPLRISANLAMWLHYDVMANILFQLHGIKTLILFPPSDLKNLHFPPGSTTSILDIFPSLPPSSKPSKSKHHQPQTSPAEIKPRIPPNTHPQIITLVPGDALFIPPLWSHCGSPNTYTPPSSATATTPTSHIPPPPSPTNEKTPRKPNPAQTSIQISINTFFPSLSPSLYPAGRDVYGNRDLAAYEDGRRDVERILRRFTAAMATPAHPPPAPPPPAQTTTLMKTNATTNDTITTSTTTSNPDPKPGKPIDEDTHLPNGSIPPPSTSTSTPSSTNPNPEQEPEPDLESGTALTQMIERTQQHSIPRAMAKAYLERLAAELLEKAEKL